MIQEARVVSHNGTMFTGYIKESYDSRGACIVTVFRHACIELHPQGRQTDDPLDKGVAVGPMLPRDIGGFVTLYGRLATVFEPDHVEILRTVLEKDLMVKAPRTGTWIEHYGVDKLAGVLVVCRDELKG